MNLKKYNVTVKSFNPTKNINDDADAQTYVLPVDSPDEEHGISAAMSNAVAFTAKHHFGRLVPVAFSCIAIHERE